jgi:hypothetical protein
MVDFGDYKTARSVLQYLGSVGSKRQSRASWKGNTFYLGQNSRRWALKVYHKGDELRSHPQIGCDPESVDSFLRFEFVLRGMHLRDEFLSTMNKWEISEDGINPAERIFMQHLDKIILPECNMRDEAPKGLEGRYHPIWREWYSGTDMKTILPHNTFYRYKKKFLLHGIDISKPPYLVDDMAGKENLIDFMWLQLRNKNTWMRKAV